MRAVRAITCAMAALTLLAMSATAAAAAPTYVSTPATASDSPNVAVDASGTAYVAFLANIGGNFRVQYTTVSAAGIAGPIVTLSAAGQNAQEPQVALDASGNAHVVWTRSNGSNFIAQYVVVSAAGVPSTVLDLSAAGGDASAPQVAVDGDGAAHVVWQLNVFVMMTLTRTVEYRSVTPAGAPSALLVLSDPTQSASPPSLAVDASGTTHVVWSRSDGANNRVQYVTVSSVGSASATLDLSAAGQSADKQQLALEPNGTAHVVWSRSDGSTPRIQYATVSTGVATTPIDVSTVGLVATTTAVAVDSQGTASVAWVSGTGSYNEIAYATVSTAGAVSAPITLSPNTTGGVDASTPVLSTDSARNVYAAWDQQTSGATSVPQWVTISASGVIGTPADLSPSIGASGQISIAGDTRDGANFAWRTDDGVANRVAYERFGPDATRSPSSLAYAPRDITGGPSAAQSVTVSNDAAATRSSNITAVTITGAGAAAFSISSNACTSPIPAGGSCTISVVFDPSAIGSHSATVNISGGLGSASTVSLTGVGTAMPTPVGPTPPTAAPPKVSPPQETTPTPAAPFVACPRGTTRSVQCKRRAGGGLILYGTSRSETLIGTPFADVMYGVGGHDVLRGGSGNDILHGSRDASSLFGGAGNDVLYGGRDSDHLYGEAGNDRLYGGAGHDWLYGGAGNDALFGQYGWEHLLRGGSGRNIVLWEPQ